MGTMSSGHPSTIVTTCFGGESDRGAKPCSPALSSSCGSTGMGLEELAEAESASLIVFGSDYRTPPGHAEPSTSAQRLLEIGATGIAVAAAGLRAKPDSAIGSIAVIASAGDDSAQQTADALAQALGAQIAGPEATVADLIVAGSQPGVPVGRIGLSGSARTALDASLGSVLVVPSGKPVLL